MSEYTINIIDTTDNTHVTEIENASRKAIVLSYEGSDEKDELNIIGSSLKFNMEVLWNENTDGFYSDLFTGDESKYKVEITTLYDTGTQMVWLKIWQGFLLPDSYSEPYKAGTYYVDFEATDGLGRLKGKFLPDDFYMDEKSVMEIVSKCLELTGLEMPLYFAPGVENYEQKNWHELYLDGLNFIKSNKKQDAHTILKKILTDTVSCLYQYVEYWYFEGLNKRNLVTYSAKEYDYQGNYVQDIDLSRNVKSAVNRCLANPYITTVAPYGVISVTHEKVMPFFPKTTYQEVNDGWVLETGVVGEIYATDWVGHNSYYAKSIDPDYKVSLKNNEAVTPDTSKYVNLKKKIYLHTGAKVTLKIEFEIIFPSYVTDASEVNSIISSGLWKNPLYYAVKLGSTTLFTNNQTSPTGDEFLSFDTDKKAELNFEFLVQEGGLLDIEVYEPYGDIFDNRIDYVNISNLEINIIGFEENPESLHLTTSEYTRKKEIELTTADDATGFSNAFLLEKLREATTSYNEITIPVLYGFTNNGNYYSVVQLDGANLIADNINTVYYNSVIQTGLEVIYNYQNGEQMVVKTPTAITSGNFVVRAYAVNDIADTRTTWQQWTDSIYGIETDRYIDTVNKIYRRLFSAPHEKIDMTVNFPVLMNDIIQFNYKQLTKFIPTNISWNLDSGETTVTAVKRIYQESETYEGENLPPVVNAGDDIYIASGVTQVTVSAVAADVDGFVASQQWQETEGDTNSNIQSPTALETVITNLNADLYEFEIEVTDNEGATATDTVRVIRIKDYTVSLTQTNSVSETNPDKEIREYQFAIAPSLPTGYSVTLTGNIDLECEDVDDYTYAKCIIYKNGITLQEYLVAYTDDLNLNTNFNNINSDDIDIKLEVYSEQGGTASAAFSIVNVVFNDFEGNISGLPVTQSVSL